MLHSVLATKTRQVRMENYQSYKAYELEGIVLKGCRTLCVESPQWHNLAKKKLF